MKTGSHLETSIAELKKQIRGVSLGLVLLYIAVVACTALLYMRINDLGELNLNIAKSRAETTAEYMKLLLKGDDE